MIIDHGKRVLQIEAQAILDLMGRIDERFVEAVDILHDCRGRVVVTGMGKSGIIAKKIAATLASTGTPAFYLHPAEGIHGDLGMLCRGDVVIALSNSGETEELLKILPVMKRFGIPLICLTGNLKSNLAKHSTVVIDVGIKEEACRIGSVPTASTTAALAMGDALSVALLEKRGFKEEDFASFHPGGVIGKRLLLRVEDVMHTGHEIPVVYEDTPMKEVIYEMTSKKLGITTVQNRQGRLTGVFTDGDLRRLFQKTTDIFHKTAADVMIRTPRIITRDILATQAVLVMERYSITVLVVVDATGKPEGIVHLHDILKMGII
ncbi:MAG: KpsF/GutQ family sugar-phosphate isomerase [Nitrospira sp.]|nr:KpsF/GutQ family sugar-phosphate isomerase [Nitrospira sp.]